MVNASEKGMVKYRLKLLRHVTLEAVHKRAVFDMKGEAGRKILVTIGDDHRLCIVDLEEKKLVGKIKVKNANLSAMCLNEDLRRVYVSSQQCQVFVFSIKTSTPLILKTFTYE